MIYVNKEFHLGEGKRLVSIKSKNNDLFRFYISVYNIHLLDEFVKLFESTFIFEEYREDVYSVLHEKARCNDRIAVILMQDYKKVPDWFVRKTTINVMNYFLGNLDNSKIANLKHQLKNEKYRKDTEEYLIECVNHLIDCKHSHSAFNGIKHELYRLDVQGLEMSKIVKKSYNERFKN